MSILYILTLAVAAYAQVQNSSTTDVSTDSLSKKLQPINYGAFTQTATYSVANQLGFFQAYGLNVTYLQVPNSTYGYNQLLNGGYDIMTGTVDNAVNLRFNQQQPLTVTGQLDGGPELTIASIPSITSISQLKGKALMVDSPVSGYAYILRKVLALYGLYLENGDYTFQVVGSTVIRYADLVNGSLPDGTPVYATIFTYPFTSEGSVLPAAQRPNILASIVDFIQPFTSSAFTIREDALNNSTQRALARKFTSAMYAANKYLASPSHKTCSINSIAKQLNVSTAAATSAYNSATDPLTGETSSPGGNFTVNRQGILNVIDVRSQFGGFSSVPTGFSYADAIIPGTGQLIDYSLLDEALSSLVSYTPSSKC
ncbi:uncharacterized protein PV07_07522 [Cladophialophora immunda]|uniref:SsuA/THI5-like domain-containing protein n=1 Tax=Cladophialophora immunda TaxID=569365 RepID=A0A0D2CVX7_9EURO|nr:uncharacterized protein PV07_07522 [Cladophialophora immunda]KIW27819.1 hypothetical protein PV07_07522 [Cladophialophora immunda]OQV02972.1 hypothetical protein CLAIMM_08079 [Cladophialophora immunda]